MSFFTELLYQVSDHILLGYADFYEYNAVKYLRERLRVHGRVLDIGCSSGKFLKHLSDGIKAGVGIDIAGRASDFKNISFIKGDATKRSRFKDNSFDYVTCFEVIEHIRSDKDLVKEVRRILKPGGYFVLSMPYLPAWEKYSSLEGRVLKKMDHVRIGYKLDFFEGLKGFRIIDYRFFNKSSLNQLISIKPFILLPPIFYYIFLSPLYRLLTIPFYFYDKYSNRTGLDLFVAMQKIK